MLLLRIFPVVHFVGPTPDEGVQVLQAVGRLEGSTQFFEQAQPMERQRLLEALIQTRHRRRIEQREFGADNVKRFVGNAAEWQLMNQLTQENFDDLFQKAQENRREMNEKPEEYEGLIRELITVDDLDKQLPDTPNKKALLSNLSKDPKDARMRYLFFKKFFSGTKPNTTDLRTSLNIS